MNPEHAQEYYRRPENPERERVQRDIDSYLAAGGQITHLEPFDSSYDAAAKQALYERRHRGEGLSSQKRQKTVSFDNFGSTKRKIIKAVKENPGMTAPDVARAINVPSNATSTYLTDLEGVFVERGERVLNSRSRWSDTWYPVSEGGGESE